MITPAQVVAAARRWVGTPFEHQGRLLDVGADCAGVVIGVARALGISGYDIDGYGRTPHDGLLERELDANLERKDRNAVAVGDILLLRIERDPQHLAIVTELEPLSVVHSHSGVGRCVENGLDERWRRRIVRVYRFPGVA